MLKKKVEISDFKKTSTFSERCDKSSDIMKKNPGHAPVIIDIVQDSSKLQDAFKQRHVKQRFLVSFSLTIGQFLAILRKKVVLSSEDAMFMFINGHILAPNAEPIATIYKQYKDDDGFLYIWLAQEKTFG